MTTALKTCLLTLPMLAALAACHPRDGRPEVRQRELMHTGFEDFAGWYPALATSLTTEKAHSGKYAIQVDAQHEYSPTYRAEMGQLCAHRPRRLTLGAWVWVPSAAADAVLVLSIANPDNLDHPVFHKNVYLTNSGPYGQWKYVSRDMDLTGDVYINSKSQLVIYLWKNDATQTVYADDIQLTELW